MIRGSVDDGRKLFGDPWNLLCTAFLFHFSSLILTQRPGMHNVVLPSLINILQHRKKKVDNHTEFYASSHWTIFLSLEPIQKGLRAWGRRRAVISSLPLKIALFSMRATINLGIAAAVPLRVCAKGSRVGDESEEAPCER